MAEYTGYCMRCKSKKQFEGSVVLSKNGRTRMAQGPCPSCGTKVNLILGKAPTV